MGRNLLTLLLGGRDTVRAGTALLSLAFAITAGAAIEPHSVPYENPLAKQVASLLEVGNTDSVAQLLHYPPSYSEEERIADIANLQRNFAFLINRFGLPSDLRIQDKPLSFYEVGSSGGTIEYWANLSPLNIRAWVYLVNFSKLGPGILKIHLFQPKDKSKLELQGVAFGLAVSSPSARTTMIRIMVDLSKQMGQPMSPHEVEMLEQQLQSTEFQPPDEK
jgi:hypothetical protein